MPGFLRKLANGFGAAGRARKMHGTVASVQAYLETLVGRVSAAGPEVVVCPPFTLLPAAVLVVTGSEVAIAAQAVDIPFRDPKYLYLIAANIGAVIMPATAPMSPASPQPSASATSAGVGAGKLSAPSLAPP